MDTNTILGYPKLSVITAVLNRAEFLEGCLESVAQQRGVTIEHIVIDGGSTDGSVPILQRWSDRLAICISESDGGIADAMNKGLRHASGEWVLFLHADDRLLDPDSIALVFHAIEEHADACIAGFPIRYGQTDASRLIKPRGATPWMRFKTGFLHQGTFIRRRVFDDIGMHDDSLQIAMDYDFFLRAWLRRIPMMVFDDPVPTLMRDTGISSQLDWPNLGKRLTEERRIHAANTFNLYWRTIYAVYWTCYPLYRRVSSLLRRPPRKK